MSLRCNKKAALGWPGVARALGGVALLLAAATAAWAAAPASPPAPTATTSPAPTAAAAPAATAATPGPAPRTEPGADSLLRIVQSGRIVVGARDAAVPLSYLASDGSHTGYHIDICERIVAALRQRYDVPTLKMTTVPVTLATRFSMLNNNSIDIDCGHNAVNSAAQRQALVAHGTYLSEVRLMTRSEHALQPLEWLAGRPVGVIVGSTAVPALRAMARSSQFKVAEVAGRNSAEVFGLLEQGRVDAVAFSAAYLEGLRLQSPRPQSYAFMAGTVKTEPVAIVFRLADERLHALANEVIADLMRTGELARLYDKWFVRQVPGLPAPLNLPLPDALRRMFAQPGSELHDL